MSSRSKPKHYMQSAQWAHLRPEAGWTVSKPPLSSGTIFAYTKKTPAGGFVYVPGFTPSNSMDLLELQKYFKGQKNLVCKVEACDVDDPKVGEWFKAAGWKKARNVQYDHTVRLDLSQKEDDLWMGMKARGRQEVNYARKAKVKVEFIEPDEASFEIMHELLQDTSKRKSFGIRQKQTMLHLWSSFAGAGNLKLVFAKSKGEVIAGGVFLTDGKSKAWYTYAGSKLGFNSLFAPRLLLWEAALRFKKDGFKLLDLGGVPPPDNYEKSSMRGIYVFKTAFNREVTTMMPAYEMPLKPVLYPVWRALEPTAIKARRVLSKARR